MNKGVFEMGRDFLADFVGLERGVFFTLKKLFFNPLEVVESYKEKDPKVCTPFSLIVLVFSIFFIITNQIGLDGKILLAANKLSTIAGIPEAGRLAPFLWSNLPFLVSGYIILTCGLLAWLTQKLHLSFYDHVIANLYNLAATVAPLSLIVLILPLIDFNMNIFNLLMAGMFLLIIKTKKVKLRILYYYPEEVRDALKKPMVISGVSLTLILLSPLFYLIYICRL